jgi:hypothetical protein
MFAETRFVRLPPMKGNPVTDPARAQVEDVLFSVTKGRRRDARALVERWAKACEVQIDGIEERPNRLSVDMRARVVGDPEGIAAFCKETGGRRSQDPPQTARRWIVGLIDGLTNWPWP